MSELQLHQPHHHLHEQAERAVLGGTSQSLISRHACCQIDEDLQSGGEEAMNTDLAEMSMSNITDGYFFL